jgi:hypothetical protein
LLVDIRIATQGVDSHCFPDPVSLGKKAQAGPDENQAMAYAYFT